MTYGIFTSTTPNTATGINNIDALISSRRWTNLNVTFSFTDNFINDYEDESNYSNSIAHNASFESLNATQRSVARAWLKMYENVSGLSFTELTGASDRHATIRMAESDHPETAYARLPSNTVEAGDIWFNRTSYDSPVIGNYAYATFGHEIGHALGLEHGHEPGGIRNVAVDANRDSMEFSIMTYRSYINAPVDSYKNEPWGYTQSLMMNDIRAIQHMYGANFNYNSTNTVYAFSTTTGEMSINGVSQGVPGANRIFRTIWDGNGIDTYNFSNYSTNLNIDLAPGGWSDLNVGGTFQRANLGNGNYARGHVFNALQFNGDPRSLIENAYGGSGNDQIQGNIANNYLVSNAGNDSLFGYAGTDTLDGGVGNDALDGGDGNDSLYGHSGHDTLLGGNGNDYLNGTSYTAQGTGERDILTSGSYNDTDIFVLGERQGVIGRVFYNNQGNADYAIIRDFDGFDFLGGVTDRIQLMGSPSSYSISNTLFGNVISAGISYFGDLIGILQGVNASSLNLTNSSQFIYV